jgi:hypothetical protein
MGVVFARHAHPRPSVRPLICRQVGKTDSSPFAALAAIKLRDTDDRRHAAQLILGALRGS